MTAIDAGSPRTSLRALLEGRRTWGALEESDGRYGIARHRLVVYPPGLGPDERIALRLQRTFSIWGLGLWLLVEVSLMTVLSPWTAVAVATALCLIGGAVVTARAGSPRHDVRTLTAVLVTGANDDDAVARRHEVSGLAERLIRADALLAAGELTTVEHEAEVWRVYERMGAAR